MSNDPFSWQAQARAVLTHYQLDEVEAIRSGGDVTIMLDISMANLRPSQPVPYSGQLTHTIPWVGILGQLQYADVVLLEVPMPSRAIDPTLAEARQLLDDVRGAIDRGSYREAVGLCRDLLEAITLGTGEKDDTDSEVQALFTATRKLDKQARLRILRRALRVLSHPARHQDEVAVRHDWGLDDAVAMLAMTGVLLAELT